MSSKRATVRTIGAGLALAVLTASFTLTGPGVSPAAADPGQATTTSSPAAKKRTGTKRAVAVSCSPDEYCELDIAAARCVPNDKGKAKKVDCKLLKDE